MDMNSQEEERKEIAPDPQKEDNKLQEFLQKRQLQIRVLKKMLDQIPFDPEENAPKEKTPKEEQ